MRKIVFDIETCGYPFESLSESQQEYLLRYAEKEKDEGLRETKKEDAIRYLSLYPLTSKIISIGLLDIESSKSVVYYESEDKEEWINEEKHVKYIPSSENEMVESFWKIMTKTEQVVTFNGRCFDIPFIMLRSAILKIKPSRNFLSNKFDTKCHVDLLDKLTFFNTIRKFNLDFYCQAFGISSPKSKGVSGMEVKNLYEAGRIKEIAVYCGEDVLATFELYKIWNEFLNFS